MKKVKSIFATRKKLIIGLITILVFTTIAFAGEKGLYNMFKNEHLPTISSYLYFKPMDKAQEQFVDNEIEKILDEIITEDMSTSTKVKRVHYYIVSNIRANTETNYKTPYDALAFGKSDSVGNAMLMQKMLEKLSIPNKIVSGEAPPIYHTEDMRPRPHAWNLVEVDGKWYHFDTSYDSHLYTTKYCGVTDKYLADLYWQWHENYPDSAETNLTITEEDKVEYARTKELVNKYKDVLSLISYAMTNFSESSLRAVDNAIYELPDYPEKYELYELTSGLRYYLNATEEFKVPQYDKQ